MNELDLTSESIPFNLINKITMDCLLNKSQKQKMNNINNNNNNNTVTTKDFIMRSYEELMRLRTK